MDSRLTILWFIASTLGPLRKHAKHAKKRIAGCIGQRFGNSCTACGGLLVAGPPNTHDTRNSTGSQRTYGAQGKWVVCMDTPGGHPVYHLFWGASENRPPNIQGGFLWMPVDARSQTSPSHGRSTRDLQGYHGLPKGARSATPVLRQCRLFRSLPDRDLFGTARTDCLQNGRSGWLTGGLA